MSFSEWKKLKLGEISTKITKGTTPTSLGFPFVDKGINFIKVEALTFDGTIDYLKFSFISEEANVKLKRSIIEEGDILFSMAGMVLGKTAVVKKEHLPANTNQALAIIRLNQAVALPRFVEYFMRQSSFFNYVNSSTGQSAQPNINLEEIGNLVINLPPKETQKRIASILSSLDDKIELNRQTNKTLEAIARTIFNEWFVKFNYPNATNEMVESELGFIPKDWVVKSMLDISEVTDFVANGSFASLAENVSYKSEEDYSILIRLTDYNRGFNGDFVYVDEKAYNFLSKSALYGNEIIIANVGANAGDVFRTPKLGKPMTLGPNAIMIKPNILTHYLYLFFISKIGQKLIKNIISGSAQPKFNKTDFRKLKIVIPEIEVISQFNLIYQSIDDKLTSNIQEAKTLMTLRDSLLPKLMKGEISI